MARDRPPPRRAGWTRGACGRELDGRRSAPSGPRIDDRLQPSVGSVQLVSGEYFSVLGQQPQAGRLLTPDDNRVLDGHPVAVVSYSYWQRSLGGASDAIGQTLAINGTSFTIVGMTAPQFFGTTVSMRGADAWVPVMMQSAIRYGGNASSHDDADTRKPWPPQENIEWLNVFARVPRGTEPTSIAAALTVRHHADVTSRRGGDADRAAQLRAERIVLAPAGRGLSSLRESGVDRAVRSARDDGHPAVDCQRQRRQPARGAGNLARARDCGALVSGRRPRATHPPTPRREPPARSWRRCRGARARGVGPRSPARTLCKRTGVAHHARHRARLARAGLLGRHVAHDRAGLRAAAGVARHPRARLGVAQAPVTRGWTGQPPDAPRRPRARRGADGVLPAPPHRRGPLREEPARADDRGDRIRSPAPAGRAHRRAQPRLLGRAAAGALHAPARSRAGAAGRAVGQPVDERSRHGLLTDQRLQHRRLHATNRRADVDERGDRHRELLFDRRLESRARPAVRAWRSDRRRPRPR